jgi:hypothetical protein
MYKLDLGGVQEVMAEVAPNQLANTHFSKEMGMRIISAVKRLEFVSDRLLYIIYRGSCPNRG